ncbi:response regulator transcription factor [Candidatus Saccharibacteria bacterium]|nr:response regulator transcription factor [Candidatus Saccharibacteria bacterium]
MRVLIIEDEHKIAAALKRGLDREGYATDLAYNSDDGLDAALSGDYELIVLDRMLPGSLEGLEVCQQLRTNKIHTPIIMLTAKDNINDRVAGLNAGADDYLVKPFAFEELVARMRALMRRPGEALTTVLTAGDLTLNTTTYEVRRDGKLITLSNKEFTLLHYLMRHQNQVLSKNNIIAHVWDFDADILDNTVEVYIGYLRNKIDKPFKSPSLIHTIRGFGYRLGAE